MAFIEKMGTAAADRWLERWTSSAVLTNGRQSAKQAFDASAAAEELSASAQRFLVVVADAAGESGEAVAGHLLARYSRSELEAIAARLHGAVDDAHYSDRAVGQVGRLLADEGAVTATPDAAEVFASPLMVGCR